MPRHRITISLSTKNEDAATVLRALEQAPYWKRSAELVRWAAAYLNGESMARTPNPSDSVAKDDELNELLDAL